MNDLSHPNFLFRTIWISDVHLGTSGAQVEALLHFLKHTQCDTLYLVGDIIDGWQLKKRFFWPQKHNDALELYLSLKGGGRRKTFFRVPHRAVAYLKETAPAAKITALTFSDASTFREHPFSTTG